MRPWLTEIFSGQGSDALVVGAVLSGQRIRQLDVTTVEHEILRSGKRRKARRRALYDACCTVDPVPSILSLDREGAADIQAFEAHQIFVIGGDNPRVDHSEAVGIGNDTGAAASGVVVAHFGTCR